MLQRRTFISGLSRAGIAAAFWFVAGARAQVPTRPIARPPGMRPGGLVPGRFGADGGVASGALPGVYVVVSVDVKSDLVRLRDEGGRIDVVHVNDRMLDLESLKPGDEVEVDFLLPEADSTRLEAGNIWKVQR
ncbi:MAG: hypothetical protein ACAH21_08545 [Ramlibacter sp.]